jgi:arsenate reductase (thioredoxin)
LRGSSSPGYVDWPVADPGGQDEETVPGVIADIDGRVRHMLTDLVPDLELPPSVLRSSA